MTTNLVADALVALRESTTATLRLIDAITAEGIEPGTVDDVPSHDTAKDAAPERSLCSASWQRGPQTLRCGRGDGHFERDGRRAHRDPVTFELWTDEERDASVMIGPGHPDYVHADVVDDPPPVDREDRWIGTGEPVVEAPPAAAIEGAMPPDHCGTHRAHNGHCGPCIAALEAQDTWRSSTANRIAAAKAEVAREIAAGEKPLPPGRQAFREAKREFDAKRERATDDQKSAITVILGKRGIVSRPAVLAAIGEILGREVSSRNDMTKADASWVMDHLNAIPLPPEPAPLEAVPPLLVEGPAPFPRTCGMCGHDHDGECAAAVAAVEDDEEVVIPCGCPDFVEPDYGDPDDVGVLDVAAGGVTPDEAAASDVQGEQDDPTTAVRDGGDRAAAADDAPADPDDTLPAIDRILAGLDDGNGDEFDRTRPGWRDYDTGGTYAMTTTGGPDEPIF